MNSIREYRYTCNVYEKAEHWNFEASTFAENETKARDNFLKDYPKPYYRVSDVRFDNCYYPNFE